MWAKLSRSNGAPELIIGTAVVIVPSLIVYGWILSSVLKVPVMWVLAIMVLSGLLLVYAALYGQQRRATKTETNVAFESTTGVSVSRLIGYMLSLVGLAVLGFYLLGRPMQPLLRSSALLGIFIVTYFVVQALPRSTVAATRLPRPATLFRPLMIGVFTIIPAVVSLMFMIKSDVFPAIVFALLFALIVPSSVRRIRTDLRNY